MALLEDGERAVEQQYKASGWDRYLLLPPVDNARNVADLALMLRCYKVRGWPGCQVGVGGQKSCVPCVLQCVFASEPESRIVCIQGGDFCISACSD